VEWRGPVWRWRVSPVLVGLRHWSPVSTFPFLLMEPETETRRPYWCYAIASEIGPARQMHIYTHINPPLTPKAHSSLSPRTYRINSTP
jgi:hypothetical protein